jgi:translocator protein
MPTGARGAVSASADWGALAAFLGVCFTAAALGAAWTSTSVGDWYPSLRKPTWNPPDWVFGPVWSALYAAMAVAAWLVWRGGRPDRWPALVLFGVQLGLNVAWSALFFGWRSPAMALGDIALLWLAILATAAAFARVAPAAGALLVPYLAWVGFAAALNWEIWRLNA